MPDFPGTYVCGVVLMEVVGSIAPTQFGLACILNSVTIIVQEALEMTSMILFIRALLRRLLRQEGGLLILGA